MKKISRELKIGLVSLIALILLIWGVNYLKGINVFKHTTKYYAVYNDISGLIESAVVYLNGYKIGNVTSITFNKDNIDKIVIEMSLEQNVPLVKNTRAVIRSSSLISGVKDIYLEMGNGPGYYTPGDTLVSEAEAGMMDILDPVIDQVEVLVNNVDSLTASLNVFLDEKTREDLQGTIANLNAVMNSLRQSLGSGGSLSNSFKSLESISNNLQESNSDITNTLGNLAAITDTLKSSDLKMLIAHLDQTFNQASALMGQMKAGEGTAGKLFTNDSLYVNLNNSLASLDSLLTDMREHPGRYVRFSLFGGKEK